jgi:hypothetical protein
MDARLVMDLAVRAVGPDVLALHIVGVEAEHVGFLAVHPDDGVTVGHGVSQWQWRNDGSAGVAKR